MKSFKYILLGLAMLFAVDTAMAQLTLYFPKNIKFIGGGFQSKDPYYPTLESALNKVKATATSDNPYGFWIASDTLWIADWDSVFTESGLTMKDSIDIYYVATGKIKWMPIGFGSTGGSGSTIVAPDDVTLRYQWPTWDQVNFALSLWQRMIGAAIDSIDEEVFRLIVYTATPLYIENDTLKIDVDALNITAGWNPDTTTVMRTTGTFTNTATNTWGGTNTTTGSQVFSGSGNIQLPASNGASGQPRRIWGTTDNIYYSGAGGVGDSASVAMIDLATGELRNVVVGWNTLTAALQAIIDGKAVAEPPHTFMDEASYTPNVTGAGVYTKITPTFNVVEAHDMTVAGDSITVLTNYAGSFFIQIVFTIQNAAADDFTLQIRKNNVSEHSVRFTGAGASEYIAVSTMHYFQGLVAGDDISFYITNTVDADDPVMTEINIFMYRIHP